MQYHITGINHSKGSHMTLEIEAPSKAAAERKARLAGMDVQHVQDMTHQEHAMEKQNHRTEASAGGLGWVVKLLVAAAIVMVIVAIAWPKVRDVLNR